jgi:hypothetical protein
MARPPQFERPRRRRKRITLDGVEYLVGSGAEANLNYSGDGRAIAKQEPWANSLGEHLYGLLVRLSVLTVGLFCDDRGTGHPHSRAFRREHES